MIYRHPQFRAMAAPGAKLEVRKESDRKGKATS